LALDEPKEDDQNQQVDGVEFVISERDASMVLQDGPVTVQYNDQGWWKGYRVVTSRGPGTC